ncbi:MAG: transposase [Roseiflexaceae bacterium]
MPHHDDQPGRRTLRLGGYDYAGQGAYFVTICAWSRGDHFGSIDAAGHHHNAAGQLVAARWEAISSKFPTATLDAYVVMPDHLHGIIALGDPAPGVAGATLGQIIGWFKTMTTNAYIRGVREQGWPPFAGRLWQRNYYEHIIRHEDDLARVRAYIDGNPARWFERRKGAE